MAKKGRAPVMWAAWGLGNSRSQGGSNVQGHFQLMVLRCFLAVRGDLFATKVRCCISQEGL